MHPAVRKITITTLSLLLQILLALALVALLLSATLRFTLFSPTFYQRVIANPAYLPLVRQAIESDLMAQASYVGVPDTVLFAGLDDAELHMLLRSHVSNVAAVLNSQADIQTLTYPSERFLAPLRQYLDESLASQGKAATPEQLKLLDEVARTSSTWVIHHVTLIDLPAILAIGPARQALTLAAFFASLIPWLAFLTLLLAGLLLLVHRNRLLTGLASTLRSSWFAASLLLVPALVLAAFNLPRRLAIETAYFKFTVDQMLSRSNQFVIFWAGLILVIASTSLVALKFRREA